MKVTYNWLRELLPGCDLGQPLEVARVLTSIGHAVDTVTPLGEDAVFDIDVTSNRPDCLSVIGIARELAAYHDASLAFPPTEPVEEGAPIESLAAVAVDRPDLCPRYSARVFTDVKIVESPAWLRRRLEALGQRSINSVVDVTNYVMFEMGHPIHAFDLDRLGGRAIRVRLARAGERIRTLDGVDRTLDCETLVIADQCDPVALAGIMGGEATEVSLGTKRILLESAVFQPRGVRRSSKRLGLRTEASIRMEKGCDLEATPIAAARVCRLLQEMGCLVARGYLDVRSPQEPRTPIEVTAEQVAVLLGVAIPIEECATILERLSFGVRVEPTGILRVRVPSHRLDVAEAVDVIEEIARIYGYDRIPAALPPIDSEPEPLPEHLQFEETLRDHLAAMGLTEVITYSFIAPRGDPAPQRPLLNPISERTHLRASLVPGLLEAALHNVNHGREDVRLFEIGHLFLVSGAEVSALGVLVSVGPVADPFWCGVRREADFYDLKGILEELFDRMGRRGIVFSAPAAGAPAERVAVLSVGRSEIGFVDIVSIDSKHAAYVAELRLDVVQENLGSRVPYRPVVRYPVSVRDVSLLIDDAVECATIVGAVVSAGGPELVGTSLVDLFRGEKIPAGKKSLTLRLRFQSADRTLTSADVDALHEKCVRAVEALGGVRR